MRRPPRRASAIRARPKPRRAKRKPPRAKRATRTTRNWSLSRAVRAALCECRPSKPAPAEGSGAVCVLSRTFRPAPARRRRLMSAAPAPKLPFDPPARSRPLPRAAEVYPEAGAASAGRAQSARFGRDQSRGRSAEVPPAAAGAQTVPSRRARKKNTKEEKGLLATIKKIPSLRAACGAAPPANPRVRRLPCRGAISLGGLRQRVFTVQAEKINRGIPR